jgi:hypothetical protein
MADRVVDGFVDARIDAFHRTQADGKRLAWFGLACMLTAVGLYLTHHYGDLKRAGRMCILPIGAVGVVSFGAGVVINIRARLDRYDNNQIFRELIADAQQPPQDYSTLMRRDFSAAVSAAGEVRDQVAATTQAASDVVQHAHQVASDAVNHVHTTVADTLGQAQQMGGAALAHAQQLGTAARDSVAPLLVPIQPYVQPAQDALIDVAQRAGTHAMNGVGMLAHGAQQGYARLPAVADVKDWFIDGYKNVMPEMLGGRRRAVPAEPMPLQQAQAGVAVVAAPAPAGPDQPV